MRRPTVKIAVMICKVVLMILKVICVFLTDDNLFFGCCCSSDCVEISFLGGPFWFMTCTRFCQTHQKKLMWSLSCKRPDLKMVFRVDDIVYNAVRITRDDFTSSADGDVLVVEPSTGAIRKTGIACANLCVSNRMNILTEELQLATGVGVRFGTEDATAPVLRAEADSLVVSGKVVLSHQKSEHVRLAQIDPSGALSASELLLADPALVNTSNTFLETQTFSKPIRVDSNDNADGDAHVALFAGNELCKATSLRQSDIVTCIQKVQTLEDVIAAENPSSSLKPQALHLLKSSSTPSGQLGDPSVPYSQYNMSCASSSAQSVGIAFGEWNGNSAAESSPGAAIVHTSQRSASSLVPYDGMQPGSLSFHCKSIKTGLQKYINLNSFQVVEFWSDVDCGDLRPGMVTVGVPARTNAAAPSGYSGIVHIGSSNAALTSLSTGGGVTVGGELNVCGKTTFLGEVVFNVEPKCVKAEALARDFSANRTLVVGRADAHEGLQGSTTLNNSVKVFGDVSLEQFRYNPPSENKNDKIVNSSLIVNEHQAIRFRAHNTATDSDECKFVTRKPKNDEISGKTEIHLQGTLRGGSLNPQELCIPRQTALNDCTHQGHTRVSGTFDYGDAKVTIKDTVQGLGADVKLGPDSTLWFDSCKNEKGACVGSGVTFGPILSVYDAIGKTVTKSVTSQDGVTVKRYSAETAMVGAGSSVQMRGAVKGGILMPDRMHVGYNGNEASTFQMSNIKNVLLDGVISIGDPHAAGVGYRTCGYNFEPEEQIYAGRDIVFKHKKNLVLTSNGDQSSQVVFTDKRGNESALMAVPGTLSGSCAVQLNGEMIGGTLRPAELVLPSELVCDTTRFQRARLSACTLEDTAMLNGTVRVMPSGGIEFARISGAKQAHMTSGQCIDTVTNAIVNCVKLSGTMVGGILKPDRLEIPPGTSVNVSIGAPLNTTTFEGNVIVDSKVVGANAGMCIKNFNVLAFGSDNLASVVLRAPDSASTRVVLDTSKNGVDVSGQYGLTFQNGSKLVIGSGGGVVEISSKILADTPDRHQVVVEPKNAPIMLVGNQGLKIGQTNFCRLFTKAGDGVPALDGQLCLGGGETEVLRLSGKASGGQLSPDQIDTQQLEVPGCLLASADGIVVSGIGSEPIMRVCRRTSTVSLPGKIGMARGSTDEEPTVIFNESPVLHLGEGVRVSIGDGSMNKGISVSGGAVCMDAPLTTSALVGTFSRNDARHSFNGVGSNGYFDMVNGRPALRTVHPFKDGLRSNGAIPMQIVVALEFLFKGDFNDANNTYAAPFAHNPNENKDDLTYTETHVPKRVWRLFRTGKNGDINSKVVKFGTTSDEFHTDSVAIEHDVPGLGALRTTTFMDGGAHLGGLEVGTWRATVMAYRWENVLTQNKVARQHEKMYPFAYYGARMMSISHHMVFVTPPQTSYDPLEVRRKVENRNPTTNMAWNPCNLAFITNIVNNNDVDAGWGPFSSMSDI